MEKNIHNHELHVHVTSQDFQNNYHKLWKQVNIQRAGSREIW